MLRLACHVSFVGSFLMASGGGQNTVMAVGCGLRSTAQLAGARDNAISSASSFRCMVFTVFYGAVILPYFH